MSSARDRVYEKWVALEAALKAEGRLPGYSTPEADLYYKTVLYLDDPGAGKSAGLALLREWRVACFNNGGRDVPADVREAIEQKMNGDAVNKTVAQPNTSLSEAIDAIIKEHGEPPRKIPWKLFFHKVRAYGGAENDSGGNDRGWHDRTIRRYVDERRREKGKSDKVDKDDKYAMSHLS